MTRLVVVLMIVVASTVLTAAQAPAGSAPEFDVASVKPTTFRFHRPIDSLEQVCWKMRCRWSERLYARDAPLRGLIQMAYEVWGHQIDGLPGWVDSARYEIDARASGAVQRIDLCPHGIEIDHQARAAGNGVHDTSTDLQTDNTGVALAAPVDLEASLLRIDDPVEGKAERRILRHLVLAIATLVARRGRHHFDGDVGRHVHDAAGRWPAATEVHRQIRLPPVGRREGESCLRPARWRAPPDCRESAPTTPR